MTATMDEAMTCRQLVDFLGEYVAGTLDAATRARFETHLAGCVTCTDYLRGYRDTIRLAKDVGRHEDQAAADMPAELVDAIIATIRPSRR